MMVKRLLIVGAAIAMVSCNTRTPVLDDPVLTTAPSSFTSSVPAPNATPFMELVPSGVMGGNRGRSIVSFSAPPAEGTVVTVRASDPAVAVTPSQIEWPRNAFSIEFMYTTPAVTADRNVQIIASASDRSASAQLSVWAPAPFFFAFSSDRNAPEAPGRSSRLLPSDTQLDAFCSSNQVTINVRPFAATGETQWSVNLTTPSRTPLRPGVYDAGSGGYGLSLINSGSPNRTNCQLQSRITVREVELRATSEVVRLWATLEQTCVNTGATTRVDIRVVDPQRPAGPLSSCTIQ
ncbi:MAG: hypothetical protein K2Y23_19155 [Cyanobacteria bacterium]|nr:hypothetical protein [Cyanobacteriota bacterium]